MPFKFSHSRHFGVELILIWGITMHSLLTSPLLGCACRIHTLGTVAQYAVASLGERNDNYFLTTTEVVFAYDVQSYASSNTCKQRMQAGMVVCKQLHCFIFVDKDCIVSLILMALHRVPPTILFTTVCISEKYICSMNCSSSRRVQICLLSPLLVQDLAMR